MDLTYCEFHKEGLVTGILKVGREETTWPCHTASEEVQPGQVYALPSSIACVPEFGSRQESTLKDPAKLKTMCKTHVTCPVILS